MKVLRLTHAGIKIRFTWREVTKLRVFLNFFRLNNGNRFSRGEDIFAVQLDNRLKKERKNYEVERESEKDGNAFGTVRVYKNLQDPDYEEHG